MLIKILNLAECEADLNCIERAPKTKLSLELRLTKGGQVPHTEQNQSDHPINRRLEWDQESSNKLSKMHMIQVQITYHNKKQEKHNVI